MGSSSRAAPGSADWRQCRGLPAAPAAERPRPPLPPHRGSPASSPAAGAAEARGTKRFGRRVMSGQMPARLVSTPRRRSRSATLLDWVGFGMRSARAAAANRLSRTTAQNARRPERSGPPLVILHNHRDHGARVHAFGDRIGQGQSGRERSPMHTVVGLSGRRMTAGVLRLSALQEFLPRRRSSTRWRGGSSDWLRRLSG